MLKEKEARKIKVVRAMQATNTYSVWYRQTILDTWRMDEEDMSGMDAGIRASVLIKDYRHVCIVEDGADPNDF